MFKWFDSIFSKVETNYGVLPEPIGVEEKTIPFEEIVGKAEDPIWKEKLENELRSFPATYQGTTASCVAHSICLAAGIDYQNKYGSFVKFAPLFNYYFRSNKNHENGEGMIVSNAYNIVRDKGFIPYDLLPSSGFTESQANQVKIQPWFLEIGHIFRLGKEGQQVRISVPKDFDTIASIIQKTKKGVTILLKIGEGEWQGATTPRLMTNNPEYGHEVVIIDFYTKNGKKFLRIQDSADKAFPFKDISEEYFKERAIQVEYGMTFRFAIIPGKPVFDGSIRKYQEILRYEGLFPINIDFIENWGPVTQTASNKFTDKYGLPRQSKLSLDLVKYLLQNYNQ